MSKEPLASLVRPKTIDDFVGQEHILGPDCAFRKMIEDDKLRSVILYGPPGTGKTTLANIIANKTSSIFMRINATNSSIKEIRECIKQARLDYDINKKRTVVFVDEIYRFAKNVQDALLPSVEDGTITLIGATTENPYFSVNSPLISRSLIYELKSLTPKDVLKVIQRGIQHYHAQGVTVKMDPQAAKYIMRMTSGDARKSLTAFEFAVELLKGDERTITLEIIKQVMPSRSIIYDGRMGEGTYDALSGIQGSIQASDVHGAVFWLSWAINNGEELEVISRRLLVTAAEDIGICDPMVLVYVNSAVDAAMKVGFPEAKIILSSAVAYMAMSKRSKASARAIWAADELFESKDVIMPDYLKDCHYEGSKELGRGSYHDGANMDVYKAFPYGLFKAENGQEIDHMKHNDKFWEGRR